MVDIALTQAMDETHSVSQNLEFCIFCSQILMKCRAQNNGWSTERSGQNNDYLSEQSSGWLVILTGCVRDFSKSGINC